MLFCKIEQHHEGVVRKMRHHRYPQAAGPNEQIPQHYTQEHTRDKAVKLKMDEAEDDALKVGAAIVAGEHEKAKKWLAGMQNVKREEFLQFPIVNLLS